MWTDGRYYIQAVAELYTDWKMMKMQRGEINLTKYINANLKKGATIGLDYNMVSKDYFDYWNNDLKEYKMVHDPKNIVDQIWENQPKYSCEPVNN